MTVPRLDGEYPSEGPEQVSWIRLATLLARLATVEKEVARLKRKISYLEGAHEP